MKVSIIYNPTAGTKDVQDQIQAAGLYLSKQGWEITWRQTEYPGHATQIAAEESKNGAAIVIAAGGDGTINEVVNGLVRSSSALGILPAGTGNVFAADMNIPTPSPLESQALLKAAERIRRGHVRQVDVAQVCFDDGRKRYFLLWAGIGLDAAITNAYEEEKTQHPERKKLFGMATWLISAWYVFWDFRGTRMKLHLDDGLMARRGIMVTISNSQLYGRFWRLAPEAKIDDGLLDITFMEGYDFRASLKHLLLVSLGRHTQDPEIHTYQSKNIRIETREPMPVQLDAEAVGFTPVEIKTLPQALNIILPANVPDHHFSEI